MRRPARAFAALLIVLCLFGCGGDDAAGPAGSSNTGMVLGQVRSPYQGGDEAVPGAVVSVEGGPSAVADASGSFRISGVPAGTRVVKVAGPQSKDPNYPLTHSSQELSVDVAKGEEVQIFPTLIMGCQRVFDVGAGATVDITPCGGGGEATLTFEPGDLSLASGAAFNGTVLADIAVLDPDVVDQAAAFTQGGDGTSEVESLFGGVEVRLRDFATGNPLQVTAGQTVTVRAGIGDLGSVQPGDLVLERYDETTNDWVALPSGTVSTQGNDTFYEWEADHFSGYRMATFGGQGPKSCLALTAELPGSQVPLISGFLTELKTRNFRGPYRGKTDCIVVRQRSDIEVRLRYVAPWDGSVWETPWIPAGNIPETGCGSCVNLGHFDLESYRVGGSGDPVAAFQINPSPAQVGEEVTFDASASTDDNGIIAYAWDVNNDGVLDRYGRVATYTYQSAGAKSVKLRVSDANGNVDTQIEQLVVNGTGGGMPTLTVVIVGQGSVTSDPPGIACAPEGGTCAYQFPASTFVTLTANAYPGYTLSEMGVCNDFDPGRCYVILDSDRTVTFTFVPSG